MPDLEILTSLIKKITKRDGRVVPFEPQKIIVAIEKAEADVGMEDRQKALTLAKEVVAQLELEFKHKIPSIEDVNTILERTLMEKGEIKTAKSYILYRHKKGEEEHRKALIMGEKNEDENLSFTTQALKILERRYLLKDNEGNVIETPKKMLRRVAKNIAQADKAYGAKEEEIKQSEEQFYHLLSELKFLPNSPTLMNAGTQNQQLSACFVLPIEDTMESIFGTLRDAAMLHQRGSGTGFSFSRLRPKGDRVRENQGVAAGPVAFMKVYDSALEVIKQGGVRPGANMAILRVDHPEVIRFVESKRDKKVLKNFNISVAVTDNFMKAVEADREYYLTHPRTQKYYGRLRARDVFSLITQNAWKTGDPGLVFIDEINRKHPGKHLGEIETTNQCGEAPLLPYEGCVLGSLNLNKFVKEEEVEWDSLAQAVQIAVHFLDNVIDMNHYLLPEIETMTKNSRKFGLGMMGFADFLVRLGIKYDSELGLEMADKLMAFIKEHAYGASEQLAQQRGVCPSWKGSDHQKAGRKMRNMSCISVAPTGTISILADASNGCEPFFAISYQKTVLGDNEFIYMNKMFEKMVKERGVYSPDLIRKIVKVGSVQECKEIPKDIRELFVTSQDITPEWHIRMLATLQKNVDNAISKTINFPATASIKEVEEAYMLAWKSKCKGITIYRDGSYEEQVITVGES